MAFMGWRAPSKLNRVSLHRSPQCRASSFACCCPRQHLPAWC